MSFWDYLHFPFVQNAFYGGILVSVLAAIIGALIVVNRMVFSAEGLAHCAFGGIGIGIYFGYPPLLSAMVFVLLISFFFSYLAGQEQKRTDTIIGVLMAGGMALGILLLNLTPGYKTEPMNYLFGNILLINKTDIFYLLGFNFLLGTFFWGNYRKIMAISLDSVFMASRGVRVGLYFLFFNIFIGLGVVLSIKAVGLILLLALLTMGPYIVEKYVSSLKAMVWLSMLFNLLVVNAGLFLSLKYNLSSGPAIVLVGVFIFFLDWFLNFLYKFLKR